MQVSYVHPSFILHIYKLVHPMLPAIYSLHNIQLTLRFNQANEKDSLTEIIKL